MTTKNSKTVIQTENGLSGSIEIEKDARQGDALSTPLFIAALDGIVKKITNIGTINKTTTQIIAYVDNVAII